MSAKNMIPGVGSTGLDDGPYLPGYPLRGYVKKAPSKTPEELAAIRAKAWETRRSKKSEVTVTPIEGQS